MSPWELKPPKHEQSFYVFFGALLRMEAYRVCGAVFSHPQRVGGVLKVILCLLDPLSDYTEEFIVLKHTGLFPLSRRSG